MPPEDNPMDEVEITKEEWQAGEIARLEARLTTASQQATLATEQRDEAIRQLENLKDTWSRSVAHSKRVEKERDAATERAEEAERMRDKYSAALTVANATSVRRRERLTSAEALAGAVEADAALLEMHGLYRLIELASAFRSATPPAVEAKPERADDLKSKLPRIGEELRQIRKTNGIGLRQFSILIGAVPARYCNFENGKPNTEIVIEAATPPAKPDGGPMSKADQQHTVYGPLPRSTVRQVELPEGWLKRQIDATSALEDTARTPTFHMLTLDGETMSLTAWARRIGITKKALSARLHKGWPLELALTTPSSRGKCVR